MAARALPVTTIDSQAAGGVCAFGADDLDLVAVLQLGQQRHDAAVDLAADAGVADVGVDRIGEIDRRRAARQRDQPALRREAEDLVLEQLELGVLEELLGRVALGRAARWCGAATRRRGFSRVQRVGVGCRGLSL